MVMIIHQLLNLYVLIIIADVILSYIPDLHRHNWVKIIRKIADVVQKPIREALPENLPLDPTPMITIFLINMLLYLL